MKAKARDYEAAKRRALARLGPKLLGVVNSIRG
jgi:hypothetical protein